MGLAAAHEGKVVEPLRPRPLKHIEVVGRIQVRHHDTSRTMPCSQHREAKPAIPFVIVHPVG
jgi:hypothetical protein